jgi:serine/threonine-protein kinase TNNI3K
MENVFNETPLQAACSAGKSLELVSFLMRQPDIDANYQSKDGHTALHSACFHGHLRIVQHLLENGADQSLTARAVEPTYSEGTVTLIFKTISCL